MEFSITEYKKKFAMNLVGLVIEKTHTKYGKIAKIIELEYNENKKIRLKFADDSEDLFEYDKNILKIEPTNEINFFYRIKNDRGFDLDNKERLGPASFKETYETLGGELEKLLFEYKVLFKEEFVL
jgi:hypothetical protein